MSQAATSASTDAKRRVFDGPPIVVEVPPITMESISESIEENMTPEQWASQALFDGAFVEGEMNIIELIPQLTPYVAKVIQYAQAAAIRKAMRATS